MNEGVLPYAGSPGTGAEGGGEGWGPMTTAVVLGMAVAVIWRLWRRCCRQVEMRRVVEGERNALYRFLCDPQNLKIIHPYTTDIRMKKETEEEGGVTLKEFDWVEKVPFTVVSAACMRCDPSTSTITMDIVPSGGIHEVQLKWRLKSNNTQSSDLQEEILQTHRPTHPQQSAGPTDTAKMKPTDSADDKRTTTPSHAADDKKSTFACSRDNIVKASSSSPDKESRTTEFHNQIRVTGRGIIVVYIVVKIIESIEDKLMSRVQQLFKNSIK